MEQCFIQVRVDEKLKKDIDEAIKKIDQTIEKLFEKKEEPLQMKKDL